MEKDGWSRSCLRAVVVVGVLQVSRQPIIFDTIINQIYVKEGGREVGGGIQDAVIMTAAMNRDYRPLSPLQMKKKEFQQKNKNKKYLHFASVWNLNFININ